MKFDLSDEEKAILIVLLARVGGSGDGPRGVADKLSERLGYGHGSERYDRALQGFADAFPGYGVSASRDGVWFVAI